MAVLCVQLFSSGRKKSLLKEEGHTIIQIESKTLVETSKLCTVLTAVFSPLKTKLV
jgi:hypothetical protein